MHSFERSWFDRAYAYSRGTLPFCFLTGPTNVEELSLLIPHATKEELSQLSSFNQLFVQMLPSAQAFKEEKMRILPRLAKDLSQRLPFVSTAFHFGSTRGDIDLACITPVALDSSQQALLQDPGRDLREKYPSVDWHSVSYFCMREYQEFPKLLSRSRMQATGRCSSLPLAELAYTQKTLLEAQTLWGDPSSLESLKNSHSPSFS